MSSSGPRPRAVSRKSQRPLVGGVRAHQPRQARHRLDIVGEHLGSGRHHRGDRLAGAAQVGGEQLYAAARNRADRRYRGGAYRGAAVAQVVARHHGDHHVAQLHLGHGVGYPLRLGQVQLGRQPRFHRAEAAAPGAHAAQDHEGGGAVHAPALVDVRAARFLAYGGEPVRAHQAAHLAERLAGHRTSAQPRRLALIGRGHRVRSRLGGRSRWCRNCRWHCDDGPPLWPSGLWTRGR